MDAHNAAEANDTKSNASSSASASAPRVSVSQQQKPSHTSSVAPAGKSPYLPRTTSPTLRDGRSLKPSVGSPSSTAASASALSQDQRDLAASSHSPTAIRESKALRHPHDRQDDDAGTDGNSEAETIVLFKDRSPSNARSRKVIKHASEDRNKPNGTTTTSPNPDSPPHSLSHTTDRLGKQNSKGIRMDRTLEADADDALPNANSASVQMKKNRLHGSLSTGSQANLRAKDTSSSLSSTPASPPRSRNASFHSHSSSDSDHQRPKLAKRSNSTAAKDRLQPPERLVSHKRKAPKIESDDDEQGRKARRLRLASADASSDGASHSFSRITAKDASRSGGLSSKAVSQGRRDSSQTRSVSPQPRSHRRSHSTQLQSQSNGHIKKRRMAMPLQSTDYNSDDSSASGSPFIRSLKSRRLAAPAMTESVVSPVKIVPHKKHLDAHGQTFLARACARGEFELAKQRLEERPEDLNVADFAGNTPLQIAALNGYGNIVKFLIDAGCNLDCVNHDKDTPLLDAVDNGHLEVVRLLLDAGVNPRKANLNGVEPLERVTDDIDNAVEIRSALVEAKKNIGERRFTSEEHRHDNDDTRSLYNPDSPRRSPAPPSASSRRAATGRATKTSNHLLYMPMDDKTLRLAAGRGDQQDVIRILQVRDTFDDPEAMVAASRGGHDVVLQLLLALGKANPDPPPISNAPPEHATPILAAIGQENIKVVSLLLDQTGFDPCKRFEGRTYYELARQRQGPNWKEEEDILKKAYNDYRKVHGGKTKLHNRKDTDSRRASRTVEADDETSFGGHKRKPTSPSDERSKKHTIGAKSANTTHVVGVASKRSSEHSNGKVAAKSRQRTDRSPSISNHDAPPPFKQTKSKSLDSDSIVFSSEGETVKPRRKKLVSGRELKDGKIREQERERERQRRTSIVSSTAPTPPKQPSSPCDIRSDEAITDRDKARTEKFLERERDRARQLKKERRKDAESNISKKQRRLSETPPDSVVSDGDTSEAPIKSKRPEATDGSSKGKRSSKSSAPPDDPSLKASSAAIRDGPVAKGIPKRREDEDRKSTFGFKTKKRESSPDRSKKETHRLPASPAEKSIHIKHERSDVEMADARSEQHTYSNGSAAASVTNAESEAARQKEEERKRKKLEIKSQQLVTDAKKKEEEPLRRHRQEEEDEKRQKEEKRKKERMREAEEVTLRMEEEDKKRKKEEEKLKQRKKQEDEEKKRRQEEEEKQRQEAAQQKRKIEEEQRRLQEEKERLRQERLEKEAAEEARRKFEEEERQQRELEEQKRILAEKQAAEVRRRQIEAEERMRVSRLPPLLQWLSTCPNPKLPSIAQQFRTMQSIRYDCIETEATGTAGGREGWLLNTQVALVLGEKDLGLSRFSSWQRLPASNIAKQVLWRLEADRYALTDPDFYNLGRQLPGYYGGQDPQKMSTPDMCELRNMNFQKFLATDMFFVKASDLMSVVPQFPHLRGIRLALIYRELPENEMQLMSVASTAKWKNDPDAAQLYGFAPGPKYYVDGFLVGQQRTGMTVPCQTPPREVRVPRRGLVAVSYDDPDFAILSKAMGVDPFTFPGYASFVAKQQKGAPPSPGTVSSYAHSKSAMTSPASSSESCGIEPAHSESTHASQIRQAVPGVSSVNGVNGVNGTNGINGVNDENL